MSSTVTITQRKSRNGCDKPQLDTLRSLGLHRIGQSVKHTDTPQLRGMIYRVAHLVEVESAAADSIASSPDGELTGAQA